MTILSQESMKLCPIVYCTTISAYKRTSQKQDIKSRYSPGERKGGPDRILYHSVSI